jgi:hypothetical protein
MMKQQNFPDLISLGPNTIQVTVVEIEPGRWQALIAGGWWCAYGITKKKAAKTVTNNFNRERQLYGQPLNL